ncbi:MAG: hypothetical protein QM775_28360 [Pirellulales bacterium]
MAALEALRSKDPELLAEEAAQQRWERDLAAWKQLIQAFPKKYFSKLLKRMADDDAPLDGIQQLQICIYNETWIPQPVPPEVAEVYVNEPKAVPWLRCQDCQLLLPVRSGFWRNTQSGHWCQGNQRYFADCPACHGEIAPRGQNLSFEYWRWQPLRPTELWEFLDEAPLEVG